jgi:hypothetical protein
MKKFFPYLCTFLFLLLFSFKSKGQQVQPSSLEAYPLMVVFKVIDVTSAVDLPLSKQLLLAKFFPREAASITAASNSSLSAIEIDALKSQLKTEFQSILSPVELQAYSQNKKGSYYSIADTIYRQY